MYLFKQNNLVYKNKHFSFVLVLHKNEDDKQPSSPFMHHPHSLARPGPNHILESYTVPPSIVFCRRLLRQTASMHLQFSGSTTPCRHPGSMGKEVSRNCICVLFICAQVLSALLDSSPSLSLFLSLLLKMKTALHRFIVVHQNFCNEKKIQVHIYKRVVHLNSEKISNIFGSEFQHSLYLVLLSQETLNTFFCNQTEWQDIVQDLQKFLLLLGAFVEFQVADFEQNFLYIRSKRM